DLRGAAHRDRAGGARPPRRPRPAAARRRPDGAGLRRHRLPARARPDLPGEPAVTEPEKRPVDEAALEERLSRPVPGVAEALAGVGGDIVLLGAGGKIGPSMARMARRALDDA